MNRRKIRVKNNKTTISPAHNSLRYRLILMLICTMLPLIIVVLLNVLCAIRVIESKTAQQYRNELSYYLNQLDYDMNNVDRYLAKLSSNNDDIVFLQYGADEDTRKLASLSLHNTLSTDIVSYAPIEGVHEKDPDIYAIAAKSTSASLVNQMLTCDMLSDSIGVLMDPENGTTIESLYETETYKQLALKVRDWYEKGYIMKDQASTSETLLSLIAADKAFCGITNYTPGIEMEQMSSTNGKRVKVIPISDPLVSSTSVSVSTMCIPITCSDTTAAMKFLNLLYTNAEVINLIDWGIEGVHYVKNEDGTIRYPDGVTAETSTYNIGTQFMNANELLSYVWEGNDPNLWQEKVAFEENAIASNALGFNFDSSSVKTQMTAVSNVINQYEDALGNGTVDVESTLPQFIKALKDAGIDDIITEKQKQFDEFLATK